MKRFVEFVAEREIPDINSGLRVFDKNECMQYFPRLCNTFSFTTSQTLAYMMNGKFVKYNDIPYNTRRGKSKVKLFIDTIRTMRYITEACIYYNPLKVFSMFSILCLFISLLGVVFAHFTGIKAGYFLGIGGIMVSIIIFCIGMLAVLLKQIMDK